MDTASFNGNGPLVTRVAYLFIQIMLLNSRISALTTSSNSILRAFVVSGKSPLDVLTFCS